jgi:hypothetical protein
MILGARYKGLTKVIFGLAQLREKRLFNKAELLNSR